eukprot:7230285-Pyramimonas_sp.AAC.1
MLCHAASVGVRRRLGAGGGGCCKQLMGLSSCRAAGGATIFSWTVAARMATGPMCPAMVTASTQTTFWSLASHNTRWSQPAAWIGGGFLQ